MRVRIPQDQPSLAAALEAGADRVVLHAAIDLPKGPVGAILDRPVHISGGRLRCQSEWALIIGDGVVLSGVVIENPAGHGVRVVAGAPVLENVELRVQGVAGVCEGFSRPVLRRVVVHGGENGWLLREDTAPDGDELAVNVTGSALVTSDRAGGHLARLALVSGDRFACVEAHGESTTVFAGLTVLSAGCGALHIYGQSQIQVDGGHVHSSSTGDPRFPAVEIREEAMPTIRELRIERSHGRGIFLHGTCRPVLRDIAVQSAGHHALETRGEVDLEISGFMVGHSGGQGLRLTGAATGRIQETLLAETDCEGVVLSDQVRLEFHGLQVLRAGGAALVVNEGARSVVRGGRFASKADAAIRVEDAGRLTMHDPIVMENVQDGIRVSGRASVVVRRGRVARNGGHGVCALDSARLQLTGLEVQENAGFDLHLSGDAKLRWMGGELPARIAAPAMDAIRTGPPSRS